MSKDWLQGADVSVPIVVHEFPPAGLTLKETCVTPFPVTVALSITVAASGDPGLLRVTVGAVASTCTVTVAPVKVFPARSVTIGRKS